MNDNAAIDRFMQTGNISAHVFKLHVVLNLKGSTLTDVHINHCSFQEGLRLFNLKLGDLVGSVNFTNCTFQSNMLTFFDGIECKFLTFENCNFKDLYIANAKASSIRITDCNIETLDLQSCESDHFKIDNHKTENTSKLGRISINSPNIKLFNLWTDARHVILKETYKSHLYGNFEILAIECESFNQIMVGAGFYKGLGSIKEFYFQDQVFEGELTVHDTHIEKLEFSNLSTSKGSVHFNDISIVKAEFAACRIPAFYWNLVEFKEELKIFGCNLDGLKLNNVTWLPERTLSPNLMVLNIPWLYSFRKKSLARKSRLIDSDDLKEIKYQRDVYRQLKGVSIANRNEIEALGFYKNEMRLYWKEIRITGGEKWQNTVLIFLNMIVSDFGQNWIRPLAWLFVFHTLLYWWMVNFQFSIYGFENGVGQYFELLNPVHRTPEYVQGVDIVIEFFMRVVDAFFIWHFLKATRRFGKE